MSNQFYSYLSGKIITYFRNNQLKAGDKYFIQFDSIQQVEKLYLELKSNTIAQPFTYRDELRNETYCTYELQFNQIQLIIASTFGGLHPDFLATLRNTVGVEPGYENKAILFIHNSTLDSILGGAGSFHKEGMPFNIAAIENDIIAKLENSDFNDIDKEILKMQLENKRNELYGGVSSVFDYEDILSILERSQINVSEYARFGLFPDDLLSNYRGAKLRQRLEDNASNFAKVAYIHNYGISDLQLERYYDAKGVDRLRQDDWSSTLFSDIEKYIANKKNKTIIEYLPDVHNSLLWDREEGNTKAKSRIRNILVFNENKEPTVELSFSFTEYIKMQNVISDTTKIKSFCSGKKISVQITPTDNNATFCSLKYKTDEATFDMRIAVVNCAKKYLESIRTSYSVVVSNKVDENAILINSDENEIVINHCGDKEQRVTIKDLNQKIYVEDDKMLLDISEQYPYSNDTDLVKFRLCINDSIIPMKKNSEIEKPVVIEGLKIWKLKRDHKINFEYLGDNRLQHGTKPYFTREEFRKNLDLEKIFVKRGALGLYENYNGFEDMRLDVLPQIQVSYLRIINYYRNNKCLPSLTYLNKELEDLYTNFIKSILDVLADISDGDYLSTEQKNLFYIGMIKRNRDDCEILLSPLHPINIAYQLYVSKIDTNYIEDNETDLLRKFQSLYLLPYININPHTGDRSIYIPKEQNHSPEWKIYVEESLPRYKGSKDYVSKLVAEKIEEFIEHFSYLFDFGTQSPIHINLLNTGDSLEILEGIFRYYVKVLRKTKTKNITPIQINVYSPKYTTNAFEEFAGIDDISIIKDKFDLDLNVEDMNEEEVVDLYRENVRFYSKHDTDKFEYAHITFLEMGDESKEISTAMKDIPSGVVMGGISSGTPAVLLADAYRTGFGIKYANTDSDLMRIVCKYNSINAAINGDQYRDGVCTALKIPKSSEHYFDKVYDASNWVTFINPKVDLSYFKNDPGTKDLLIIHYSDQYNTTSSGYDAITVTRKSKQYQRVIEDYLVKHGVDNADQKSPDIINIFNAVNGDWLLRLLSSKSYFPKEKLSILSAIKYAIKRFGYQDIIWVPISLEEILRVSGGIGLRQKDSVFSTKNLGFENGGSTSDDILLIGIKNAEEIKVVFYPIEVKIGKNESNYIDKGISQALHTKDIFKQILGTGKASQANIKVRLFRNFFMQLTITSAEKLLLYGIGNGKQGWEKVTQSELRRKLLNEEYVIVDSLFSPMGSAGLISFKKESLGKKEFCFKDVYVIENSEQEGINILSQSLDEIESLPWNLVDEIETLSEIESGNVVLENEEDKDILKSNIEAQETQDLELSALEESQSAKDIVQNVIMEESRNMKILFGIKQDTNSPLFWYPNDSTKVLHTNTGIIGTMGTGKTQFTKSIITQIHREEGHNLDGKSIGILIFDYKGDYNKTKPEFLTATNAQVYCLEDLPFNPLSLSVIENAKPRLPLHTANSLKETISKAFGLGIKQETLLREVIMEAYNSRGIIVNDPATWSKEAPTLGDVYRIYIQRSDVKEDSLYAAFSNLIEFEIFEPDSSKTKGLFEILQGVVVIDLSGYDLGIQNLVVAIILDLFYAQMQAYGHSKIDGNVRQMNKFILVDEADNFLSQDFPSLKKILKEGREFGVGTILSTQLLSHFSTGDNEYANYILTWVIHNVSDLSMKDIKYIFNTKSKAEEEYLFNKIKSLEKHYSVVKMGDSNNSIIIRDKAFWELDF